MKTTFKDKANANYAENNSMLKMFNSYAFTAQTMRTARSANPKASL